MEECKLDLLKGKLDVMVLQTVQVMGPLHGYAVARRIEQVSSNKVLLNQVVAWILSMKGHGG